MDVDMYVQHFTKLNFEEYFKLKPNQLQIWKLIRQGEKKEVPRLSGLSIKGDNRGRFHKSRKSKISRKCEFQPIKSLEITLTITLMINLRLTTSCEIDPRYFYPPKMVFGTSWF